MKTDINFHFHSIKNLIPLFLFVLLNFNSTAQDYYKLIIDYQFDTVGSFHEGLAKVCNKNGKWGFIDTSGNLVIDYQFALAWGFQEGLAGVEKFDKFGFI